jgi:hypothetical protein
MARPTRALPARKAPDGLWVAVAATFALLAIMGVVATLAPLSMPQVVTEVKAVPSVERLNNVQAKYEATKLRDCARLSDGSGWLATGTVTNTAKKAQTFTVTAYFLAGDQPINYAESTVNVPAGKTGQWVAIKRFTAGSAALTCKVVAVS